MRILYYAFQYRLNCCQNEIVKSTSIHAPIIHADKIIKPFNVDQYACFGAQAICTHTNNFDSVHCYNLTCTSICDVGTHTWIDNCTW